MLVSIIQRTLSARIKAKISKEKAIMVIGPRQVGKTTLIMQYLQGVDYLFPGGNDPITRTTLDTPQVGKS